jgi:hypothetical protein
MKGLWTTALLACVAVLAFAAPKGTVPLSSSNRYPAHLQRDGVSVGAKLLTPEQVRHTFVSDLKRCCLVVEVGLYPEPNRPLDVSLHSFSIRAVGAKTACKASDPKLVAAKLQQDARAERDITVSPVAGVGYSIGRYYDPATRTERRVSGVTTTAGVGVGIGGAGSAPASTAQDRATMELELSDKGLPEGSTTTPVSGYIYFPISQNKKATYQLEYLLNGQKVVLPLSR